MKKLVLAASLLALVGCASHDDDPVSEPDAGHESTKPNHAWGSFHWSTNGSPLKLSLSSNLTPVWIPFLNTASSQWSQSAVLDTTVVAGSTSARQCRPTFGRVEVCNAKYGRTGWLGIATVWTDGSGHIVQGTVKLNDTYFEMSWYNTPAYRAFVMCQEVGHTFGLDHQDENFSNANLGSCMDYTSNPAGPLANTAPNTHDYDQLETIYAHSTSIASVGANQFTHVFPSQER